MFAAFPLVVVAVGALVLLALVTALNLLRVRRKQIALAGATLWQQALRQVPPRRLGGRWQRPLAWLLSLLLVLLLWLAAADPRMPLADDGRRHVYYLDASAWLLADDAFDAARAALLRDVAATPAADREVLLGGAMTALLLASDEPASLLQARVRETAAQARPSAFVEWLASAADTHRSATVVHYYGAAPVLSAAAAVRPAGMVLDAAFLAEPLAGNRGIVALGAAPAASGRWDAVDVRVDLDAVGGPPPGLDALEFRLDGAPVPAAVQPAGDGRGVRLTDVPAAGGTLQVAFKDADRFSADDTASLVLPTRRPVRVGVVGVLPPVLRDVLAVDPSLRHVDPAQAQVLLVAADAEAGADLPALRLSAMADTVPAFRFTARDAGGADALAGNLDALGLDQAHNAAIASELDRPVAVDVVQGATARVEVWQALFRADGSFAQSPAMPLFVNRSLHWLAGAAPWAPYAAAGRPLPQSMLLQGLDPPAAARDRALGDRVWLPGAGAYEIAGQRLQVSLLDRDLTRGVATPAAMPTAAGGAGAAALPAGWASVLLLVALLLCGVEWRLHARGRMP